MESEELLQHIDRALGVFERSRAPRTSADISVKSMLTVLRSEVLKRYVARNAARSLASELP